MNNIAKVQKKNKKTKISGFTLFVIEYNGRSVKDGQDTYIRKCEIIKASSVWKHLTFVQQEKFKNRAKQLNVKIINTHDRYNSLGEKLDAVEKHKQLIDEEKNNRRCEIENMLKNAYDLAELDNQVFYLLSTSSFYEDIDGIYPAELAIAKFSLFKGVFDTFSIKINPGKLPIGSALEVIEHSKATHKYDLNDQTDPGEENYISILTRIIQFLHPFDNLPIFFTDGNDEIPAECHILRSNQRIMKLIFEKAGEYQIADELKVYSIEELLFCLRNIIIENEREINPESKDLPFSNIIAANQGFKKVNSDNTFKTRGCDYHLLKDALPHCCLAKVKCFGYTLAKWCANQDKFVLKPGYHFPESVEIINNQNN